MKKNGVPVAFVLLIMVLGVLSATTQIGQSYGTPGSFSAQGAGIAGSPPSNAVAPATVHPMTGGFQRTVLVETFTGVWCIHCPTESQALYNLDHIDNHTYLITAELHVCAFAPGSGPCLDSYVPPDNTSTVRGSFYNVCGFPDVFFDGQYPSCGSSDNESQMQAQYVQAIANASEVPGNVSISQSATVSSPGNVTAYANVTSDITGTYNAVTYLLEYIGKTGVTVGYGPHSVGNVVRETLANHPVTLTAGSTTSITSRGELNATWNQQNLSVITLIQQNSTKIVENANLAPVTTLTTAVGSSQSTLVAGKNSTITVEVRNSSTNDPLVGATVSLNGSDGGTFTPSTGVTAANGSFQSTFTAPAVVSPGNDRITAQVAATGYTNGSGVATILVNPLVLPSYATGLTVAPGREQVTLNWTIPASGGAGLTYHIYRASSEDGAYSEIGTSPTTGYVDTAPIGGDSYWYTVSAESSMGFSVNSTPVSATSVTATPQGLPGVIGWWIQIDGSTFNATAATAQYLYLPVGDFSYGYGPDSYAYVASATSTSVTASGSPILLNATFQPRYATLQGTVAPSDASVTVDNATVAIVSGSFVDTLAAGTYTLNVTAPGYQSNASSVVLTPGNVTPVTVELQRTPSVGGGVSAAGGLTTTETVAIVGVAAGVAILLVAVVAMSAGRKPPARTSGRSPPRSSQP
ncbi:MAG: PEGA domain-containing protein [Thermoplasmata archaeon]|nr:PEGA domain-containing protein [Thermoplasmata archaeon]